MKLKETGNGVYLLPKGEINPNQVRCHPDLNFVEAIPGALGNIFREEIASGVFHFSRVHDAWCGVKAHVLFDKICRDRNICPDKNQCPVERALEQMIKDGLLVISGQRRGLLSFLNFLSPQIICPTQLLILRIWVNLPATRERESTIRGKAKP